MDNIVITIARHFGSGGKTIGHMLADDLGIKCYGREIIKMASEDSGINEALFNKADEKLKRTPLFLSLLKGEYKGKLITPDSGEFVSDQNLFNYQAKIIRELAARESCIIIGRAADYVLRDNPNRVSVFVHASREYCIEQAVARHACIGDPEKFIEKTDKYRSDFYKYYTGQEWTDARNYDLCLNSERLGFDGTMEAIKEYIKVRFGRLPGPEDAVE